MLKRKKHLIATLAVFGSFSLCLGGPGQLDAGPSEIQIAIPIQGPPIILTRPLELSAEQRMNAQQIIWECRFEETLRDLSRSRRSTDRQNLSQNPLPALSAFLTDAYQAIQK